jgi:hypothetical protein
MIDETGSNPRPHFFLIIGSGVRVINLPPLEEAKKIGT